MSQSTAANDVTTLDAEESKTMQPSEAENGQEEEESKGDDESVPVEEMDGRIFEAFYRSLLESV